MLSNETPDQLLIADNLGPRYELLDIHDYRLGYFICKNKDKSSANEDALFYKVGKDCLVFGVSDGAGGHPRGKDAAFIAGEEVNALDFKNGEPDIINLIEGINDRILSLKAGARSTLALINISNDLFRSYCVGDSEVVYWNGHGSKIYSSIPHSRVGYKVAAEELTQDESLDHNERYLVDNMLGDEAVRVDVQSKMLLKKGHTVLVGSDGLFDNFSHDILTQLIGKGSFDTSFQELADLCLKQDEQMWKKDDDISFIVIRKMNA